MGEPQDRWRLIRVGTDLLSQLGTRTDEGARITAEWGEPDADGIYEPVFTIDTEDRSRFLRIEEAARSYLDAEAEPAYSWVIESQAARHEGRPNREVERMERIARARTALREALESVR